MAPLKLTKRRRPKHAELLERLGVVALGLLATLNVAPAAEMPFIEVDPASTTAFRERGTGKPFVPVGLNYFDPDTGWAPKIWQRFDEQRVRRHLRLVAEQGFNTVRVFITLQSFEQQPGKLTPGGQDKFRRLLEICREHAIYVIPTGPELWEGAPAWRRGDRFADEAMLAAEESWWREFAGALADEPAVLAWDLANEPMVAWDTPAMRHGWNDWLRAKYGNRQALAAAWKRSAGEVENLGSASIPPKQPARGDTRLLDYQRFREHVGGQWTRRIVEAIRSVDQRHMITVGHIQWISPVMLPSIWHYAGFDLKAETNYVDFTTVHFYPIDHPRPCDSPEGVPANAIYLQALLHDCSVGKPLMIGEFNWYGGGGLEGTSGWDLPVKPVEHQAQWCNRLLDISRGRVCGWLNWAFADTPTARDISRWSGCWTSDLKLKPWGRVFGEFARKTERRPQEPRGFDGWLTRIRLDREAAVTDPAVGNEYRQKLRHAASRPN